MKKNYWLIAIIWFFGLFGQVSSLTFIWDDIVTIDTPLNEMTVIGGNNVQINAEIDGDLFVGWKNVLINANITEDAWIAWDVLNINWDIQDDLRAAGSDITIWWEVSWDIMLWWNTISINAPVWWDAHIWGKTLRLDTSIWWDLFFDGDKILLWSWAAVAWNISLLDGTEIIWNLSWAVSWDIMYNAWIEKEFWWEGGWDEQKKSRWWFHFNFFRFLTLCLLWALGLWSMPNYVSKASQTIQSSWSKTLLYGLWILVLVPIIAMILLATWVWAPLWWFLIANYIFLRVFLWVFAVIFFADMLVDRWLGKYMWTSIRAKIWVMVVLSFLLTMLPYIATFILWLFGLWAGYLNDMKILKKNK